MTLQEQTAAESAAIDPNWSVSKGEFADLIRVTPGRVSQYISSGQIGPDALAGKGRSAKIRVALACAQLKRRLDIGQRLGNGLGTNLNITAAPVATMPPPALQPSAPALAPDQLALSAPASPAAATPPAAPPPQSLDDAIDAEIKRQRLQQLERANRKQAEEEAARAGRFTETDAARQQMGRIVAQLVTVLEGGLSDLAAAVAAQFKVPQRDALYALRTSFREIRAKAAAAYAQGASDLPPLVFADLDEPQPASADAA